MKKSARNSVIRLLASACFAGASCCNALLLGQQLAPVSSQQTGQSQKSGLPPIVSPGELESHDSIPILAPVRKAESQSNVQPNGKSELPPVVSVNEMMTSGQSSSSTTEYSTDEQPGLRKGSNFPSDGEKRIAQFIQANSNVEIPHENQRDVSNTGFSLYQQPVPQAQAPLPGGDPYSSDASHSLMPESAIPAMEGMTVPGVIRPAPSIGGQGSAQSGPIVDATVNGQQVEPQLVTPGGETYFHSDGSTGGFDVDVDVDFGALDHTFDCCGFVSAARRYLIIDGVYWQREDGVVRASNINVIDDFDHTWGGRITLGSRRDSTRGIEATYMQLDSLLAVSNQFDNGTLIGALFGDTTGDLPPNAFTAFRNGTFAEQFHKSDLHSVEVNQTWWGSDVAKAFLGTRYIYFDDEFHLSMANTSGEQGIHSIDTTNHMLGLHIGGEVLYDIGYRLSFSVGGKLGGFANFAQGNKVHFNDNTLWLNNEEEDTDFAWNLELGAWARYKLTPNVRLRAGYEGLGLFDVFETETNFSTVVTSTSGLDYFQGDTVFHGPSIGVEVYR